MWLINIVVVYLFDMFGFYFYLFVLHSLCYCGLLLGVGFANCALFCLASVWFVCLGTCLG